MRFRLQRYSCSKEGKILRAGRVSEGFLEEIPSVSGLIGLVEFDQTERAGMWMAAFLCDLTPQRRLMMVLLIS